MTAGTPSSWRTTTGLSPTVCRESCERPASKWSAPFATASSLVDAATRLRPDVIITDLSMPGLTGLDVLARLKTERLDSKVIVLTMHHDADLAADAIRGGASGFLLKESAGDERWSPFDTRSRERSTSRRQSRRTSWSAWPALRRQGTAADAQTTRHPAADREGPAHEGDRGQSGPVDQDGRRPQIRNDGDPGVTSTAELVRYALDRRLNMD